MVERVVELLDKNAQAFNSRDTKAPPPGMEEKAKRRALLLDQMRGITQVVRGEFHPHQLDRYLRAVLKRIDKEFADQHGITGTALFDVLQELLLIVEGRLNEHRVLCHRVFRCRKPSKAIKAYFAAFPEEASRRELVLADATAKAVVPELMRYFLVEEVEKFLPRVYTLSASVIADACADGVNAGAAQRAINAW